MLGLLYGVNQCTIKFRKEYLLLSILSAVMIVVSLTRQHILIAAVLSFWMIFKHVRLWKRIIFLIVVCFFAVVILPNIELYKNMKEFSEIQQEQRELRGGDIREKAIEFYVSEYQKNSFTPFLGNGIPAIENSRYGRQWDNDKQNRLYVDVGWAGFFYLFGGITTLLLVTIFVKSILKKKNPAEIYLTYWMVFVVVTSMASAPILYYNQVVVICSVLFLIYGRNQNVEVVRECN